MDNSSIITLVFVVLILLFFLNHIAVTTNTIPTTSKTTFNPSVNTRTITTPGISNPYKAQYYN